MPRLAVRVLVAGLLVAKHVGQQRICMLVWCLFHSAQVCIFAVGLRSAAVAYISNFYDIHAPFCFHPLTVVRNHIAVRNHQLVHVRPDRLGVAALAHSHTRCVEQCVPVHCVGDIEETHMCPDRGILCSIKLRAVTAADVAPHMSAGAVPSHAL